MWKLISVHLEIVLISSKIGARFVPNIPWALKSFWAHSMEFLVDMGQAEARFGTFEDSVNLGA
jgi:hypothetical protein